MKTKVTRGIIELIPPPMHHLDAHLVSVPFTEVFLEGVREPIEVPGEVPYNLTGKRVRIVEISQPTICNRYENVRFSIFSNPKNTPLYSGRYRKIL